MSGKTRWKRVASCLAFFIIVTCFHYFIVTNTNASSYLRKKLSNLTNPLQWYHPSSSRSGPLHVLLLSYARTGSSFLGDLLQSHPSTFYHFEPLHFISNAVINSSLLPDAKNLLNHLFLCNVSRLPKFLRWQRSHAGLMKFKRSHQYWNACSVRKTCYNAAYFNSFCSNRSVVIAKTIRFSLKHAVSMFEQYPNLNLKIVYLVRDPRGTLNSRYKYPINMWCKKDPICFESKSFCTTLEEDLNMTCSLLSSRPNNFLIVRYEDLARDPYGTSKQLLNFLEMGELPREVDAFIKSHTEVIGSINDRRLLNGLQSSYTTFRNSSETSTRWRQETSLVRTLNLQKNCDRVLVHLGYHFYTTTAALKSNLNFDESLQTSLSKSCRDQ